MNTILAALRDTHNLSLEYVAQKIEMEVDDYKKLESGKAMITVDTAIKLSKLYRIPAEYFFANRNSAEHHNIGTGSNSNSGFINTYNNGQAEKSKG